METEKRLEKLEQELVRRKRHDRWMLGVALFVVGMFAIGFFEIPARKLIAQNA
jgi:hypothetical protein